MNNVYLLEIGASFQISYNTEQMFVNSAKSPLVEEGVTVNALLENVLLGSSVIVSPCMI